MSRTYKITLLGALYLAQGVPYGFFTIALPALLRTSGSSLKTISALSLLSLPWAFKFLWSPYVEHRGTPKRWLLTLQIAGVAVAASMTQIDITHSFLPLVIAALGFNAIAATQDIVTDGLAVRLLDTRERGIGNGLQVGAYRLGMVIGGSWLVILLASTGWTTVFIAMAAVLAVTIIPVLLMTDTPRDTSKPLPSTSSLSVNWIQRLLMPGMLVFVLLVACYRLGDQMISQLLVPFLTDQGLDLRALAWMKSGIGSTVSMIGAFLGGWFVFRVQRRTAILVTGLAQVASFGLYIAIALGKGGASWIITATVVESLLGTMATVALFTLMMDASDPDHAGVDYTLFASAVVGVNWIGSFTGAAIADAVGYVPAFVTGAILSALGVVAVVMTLDRRPAPPRVAAAWSTAR
jgi:predicted MFS family arabinose efflux permease